MGKSNFKHPLDNQIYWYSSIDKKAMMLASFLLNYNILTKIMVTVEPSS